MEFKAGTTFIVPIKFKNKAGEILQFELSDLKSQIRDYRDTLISELEITKLDDERYLFKAKEDTSTWIGSYLWDIKFYKDGIKRASRTITINVESGVTKDV